MLFRSLGILGATIFFRDKEDNNNNTDNIENNANVNNEVNENNIDNNVNTNKVNRESKILVVYFSAQSHTKDVAEKIADNLSADIFEIVPKDVYTSDDLDWTDSNSRVSREHNDELLRNVELTNTNVENWDKYDTVFIGYPIWWGESSWVVNSFVKANNFEGKTVIPFCTSASSGLGQSAKLLEQDANSGTWLEGHRFSSNPTDTEIKNWIESIK